MHTQPELHLTDEGWLEALDIVARAHGSLIALSCATASLGEAFGDPGPHFGAADVARVAPPANPAPLDLEAAHHRVMGRTLRRGRGVARTPLPLATALVHKALSHVEQPSVILDPACGGGVFLLASAQALHDRGVPAEVILRSVLRGIDVDPVAVAVTNAVLGLWARSVGAEPQAIDLECADALGTVQWGPADVVVGNPPFRSPVGAGGSTTAGGGGEGAADDAARFLARGAVSLRAGGACTMLVPRSMLAAADAAGLRSRIAGAASLCELWVDENEMFAEAHVRVVAPLLVSAARPTAAKVRVCSGLPPRKRADVDPALLNESWGPLLAAVDGMPSAALHVATRSADGEDASRTVGDLWRVTAGFRDEFYAIAAVVREHNGDHDRCRPVITTAMLDPLRCRWGAVRVRLGNRPWSAPCVDPAELEAHDVTVSRWVVAQSVPKVLLATQTRVLEAALDAGGSQVPCTPVISATGPELWMLTALLHAPAMSAHLAAQRAGSGRSVGVIRVSAKAVRALPLPIDDEAWRRGAQIAQEIASAPDEAGFRMLGAVMNAAYQADSSLLAWWMGAITRRLDRPGVPAAASHTAPQPDRA